MLPHRSLAMIRAISAILSFPCQFIADTALGYIQACYRDAEFCRLLLVGKPQVEINNGYIHLVNKSLEY